MNAISRQASQGAGDAREASSASRAPLRLALVGWGAIAQRFADLLHTRNGAGVAIVGVAARNACALPHPRMERPEDLDRLGVDLVVEAAGRDAVSEWGQAALQAARGVVIASTSALTDDALLARLLATAERHGSQLLIPPGALAGIDGLAAASRLGLTRVCHSIIKPPLAWRGTAAEPLLDLNKLTETTTFFRGSAREAAQNFPQNANVAVISALAGVGLDQTEIRLVADPSALRNVHKLNAEGAFGTLSMTIENRPLAANPKSSEMTALSLVRMVENRFRPLSC